MKEIGFRKVHSEPCVYVWEDSTGEKVVVPTYMDDCHIIGKTEEGVQHIKVELQSASSGMTWAPQLVPWH